MRAPLRRRMALAAILAPCLLTGCGAGLPGGLKLPELDHLIGSDAPDNDPSVTKISPDATIPILLSSNKPNTTFTVNGTSLSPAKMMKVLVPPARLQITAQAPCYQTLMQSAERDGFGRA